MRVDEMIISATCECAGRVRPRRAGLRHDGAAISPADLTGGGSPKRSGGVAGSPDADGSACDICPPASAARATLAP